MAQDYNENARKWLEGDFDQETKMKVIELRNNDPAGSRTHSTRLWSLAPVASGALWESEPTG